MKKNFGIILAIALGLSALLLTIAFQAGWVQATPFFQTDRAASPRSSPTRDRSGKVMCHISVMVILNSSSSMPRMEMVWSNDGNPDPKPVPLPVDQWPFHRPVG